MSRVKSPLLALLLLLTTCVTVYWYRSTVPVVIKGHIEVVDLVMFPDGGSMTLQLKDQGGSAVAIEQVRHLGRPADDRLYLVDYLGGLIPVRHRIDGDSRSKAMLSTILGEYIERNTTPDQKKALESNDISKLPRDINAKVVGVYQLKMSALQ
jgi:hypothetical protein